MTAFDKIQAARDKAIAKYGSDDIDIEGDATVSWADEPNGAWVSAWVFVSDDDMSDDADYHADEKTRGL